MTTPPLDLPALRRDIVSAARCKPGDDAHPWEEVDPDHLIELINRAEAAESSLVELKPADVLVEDSWIPVAELPTVLGNFMRLSDQRAQDAKAMYARATAAEAAIARVREVHTKEKHGVQHHCGECLQDDNTGSWEYVEWPCPTITALDGGA